MKNKKISILVALLMIATTIPVIGSAVNHEIITSEMVDVEIIFAYTTDYVNGWQDTGLRIKEFPIDGEVYAYIEVGADDLSGVLLTHRWWYDNGSGLVNQWEWEWFIPEPWTAAWSNTYWQIGLDYGPGYGYIEALADGVSIGQTNYYAMDNHQPNTPTITGDTEGTTGELYEYNFVATDPDGFDIFYCIEWGDETGEICLGPFASGEEISATHTWAEDGDYIVTCKARDLVDSESEVATLTVTMPYVKSNDNDFNLLDWLLDQFPNAFPILRYLWGL